MVKCITSFLLLAYLLSVGIGFEMGISHNTKGFDVQTLTQGDLRNQITVHLALKQRNTDHLESLLKTISNPTSSNYGEWISIEEITNFISCPPEDIEKVENWLRENK